MNFLPPEFMKKLISLFGTVALLSACTFTVSTDVNKDDAEDDTVPAEETVDMGMPAGDTDDTEEMEVEEENMEEEEEVMEDEMAEEEAPADDAGTVEDGGDGNNADGAGAAVEVNVEAGASDTSEPAAE
jgi:hypothetical protein